MDAAASFVVEGCGGRTHLQTRYKYSESMGAKVLDVERQGSNARIMGSLRPSAPFERILTAGGSTVRMQETDSGCRLSICAVHVVVTVTNYGRRGAEGEPAKNWRQSSKPQSLDVLLDDRDERAGVKFKDADLVGIPYRIQRRQERPLRGGGW